MKDHKLFAALAAVLFLTCLVGIARAQSVPTLVFSLTSKSSDGKTLTPTLTWSTSPAAASCTASGDWTGTKAASGTETLTAVSAAKAYTLSCNWAGDTKATVSWVAPTTNTDGTALTDLGSYRVFYGTDPTGLTQSAAVSDPKAVSWVSPDLTSGTWYFLVRAVKTNGVESDNSNQASKVITAAANQARTLTLGFSVPAAPTGLTAK